jgi:WD40 repeat protein
VKLWDTKSGDIHQILSGHTAPIWKIAFHPNGNQLMSGSEDGTAKLWDLDTATCIHTFEHPAAVKAIAISHGDGSRLVTGGGDGVLKLWEMATGACVWTKSAHQSDISSLSWSQSSNIFASSSHDRTIKIWDLAGNCLHTIQEFIAESSFLALVIIVGIMKFFLNFWAKYQHIIHWFPLIDALISPHVSTLSGFNS